MLEALRSNESAPAVHLGQYSGPERRMPPRVRTDHWLAATLDEIDYGILLLDDEAQAIHVNHAARAELDATHPLTLSGADLRARRPQDRAQLTDALCAATTRGLRKQLVLGEEPRRVSVSIVPLRTDHLGKPVVLVMLGKRRHAGALSIQSFATGHRLSAAETQVLGGLYRGASPAELALSFGVAISTIRTQIGSIRVKTGARSISELLQQVATLPPLMCILREVAQADGGCATWRPPMVRAGMKT